METTNSPRFPAVRLTEEESSYGTDIGDYDFEVLPRIGEKITLFLKSHPDESYRVRDVEYHFEDHTLTPRLLIRVDRINDEG